MEITNDSITSVQQSTLFPAGFVNNIDLAAGGVLASTTLVNTCNPPDWTGAKHDWVYYDFPFACETAVSYSLIQGNIAVLMEGCDDLYPATINPYDDCPNAPSSASSDSVLSVPPNAAPVAPPSTAPTAQPCSNTDGKFTVGTGNDKGCDWLQGKIIRQVRHCGTPEVQSICPSTCCDCGTCPTSRPTPAPSTTAPSTTAPSTTAPSTTAPTPVAAPTPSKGGKGSQKTRVLRGRS